LLRGIRNSVAAISIDGRGLFYGTFKVLLSLGRMALGADSFPDLRAMDGDLVVGFETKLDVAAADFEHGDREQGLQAAIAAADDDRLSTFSAEN
jgi:hypothetical protein